jgi:hypothetical protein
MCTQEHSVRFAAWENGMRQLPQAARQVQLAAAKLEVRSTG